MTDTDMLNWLEENFIGFQRLNRNECELSWMDVEVVTRRTSGLDLRDCIRGAVVGEAVNKG